MSDNWVVQNLENALETWNEKLSEIWTLITQSPQDFKGGTIWQVIVDINGAVQAIGLALLVLFFVIGVVKTCSSFVEVKKPEHALKLFVRFAIAKALVTYGMELMLAMFSIVQGIISTIMNSAGLGATSETTLPDEMVTAIESYCGVLLEGAVIILACIIFSLYASAPPEVDTTASAVTMVWKYIGELIFNMLVLVGTVKMSDRIIHEMMGM